MSLGILFQVEPNPMPRIVIGDYECPLCDAPVEVTYHTMERKYEVRCTGCRVTHVEFEAPEVFSGGYVETLLQELEKKLVPQLTLPFPGWG